MAVVSATTLAPAAPVETVTPIGPAEALRLGRLSRPRRVACEMFDGKDGACALGAMAIGWGHDGRPWTNEYRFVFDRLATYGLTTGGVCFPFDLAETKGENGDEVVLAKLAERGL